MNWKTNLVAILGLLAFSCGDPSPEPEEELSITDSLGYVHTRHLVHAYELMERLNGPNGLKLIDFRTAEQFATGHIKGANRVWRPDITDTSYAYGGMMGNRKQIANLLGSFGISASDTIIIYDDRAAANAARLWWILKVYGHKNMAILNGGLRAWIVAGGGLTNDTVEVDHMDYMFPDLGEPTLFSNREDMVNSNALLLDTRTSEEFNGEVLKDGAAFASTINGAINLSFDRAISYADQEVFHSADSLKKLFAKVGIDGTKPVITFCHSGVRSAHTLFVLSELLGYENISNYDGSWIEWSHIYGSTDPPTTQDYPRR